MEHGCIRVWLLLAVWFLCLIWLTSAATLEDERRLRQKIFNNQSYNPGIRPLFNQSNRVVIQSTLSIQYIHKLDEIKQSFQTAGWLSLIWTDEVIHWNPAEFGGIEQILLSPNKIWKPDIVLDNGVDGYKRVGDDNQLMLVTGETGTVLWTPGDVYETGCSVDVTFYPFDVQSCLIRFGSWMHDESLLQLVTSDDSVYLGSFSENGQWTVVNSSARQFTIVDDGIKLSYIEFKISIARKPMYYVLNTIIPIFSLSLMSLLVFLLPPESGEKMTLSITVLLSLTVFLTLISETMPKTSKSISLLAVYIVVVLGVDALSVMLSAVVLHFYYRPAAGTDNGSHSNIGALKRLIGFFTNMIYFGVIANRKTGKNSEFKSDMEGKKELKKVLTDGVAIARMIDRISFLVLGMILIITLIALGAVILSNTGDTA